MPKKTSDPKKEMIKFLQSQVVAVVATISPDDWPQAATVFFWVNDLDSGGFNLYFLTRRRTRKFENLLSRKEVAMVVGTEFAPSTVQIQGAAEIIDVGDTIDEMTELKAKLKKQPAMARIFDGAFYPKNPFRKMGRDFVAYRVRPVWVRWMTYDKASKEIVFHQIPV